MKNLRFIEPDICGPCGGKCCKLLPGAALPEDLGLPSIDRLSAALRSRQWAVDWWEGDPRDDRDEIAQGYFLRPATKDANRWPLDGSWGGECVFLRNSGCSLEHDARPAGCRSLEPVMGGGCVLHAASKREAAVAWLPYHKEIMAAVGVATGRSNVA